MAAATLTLAKVDSMLEFQHDPSERQQLETLVQEGDGAQSTRSCGTIWRSGLKRVARLQAELARRGEARASERTVTAVCIHPSQEFVCKTQKRERQRKWGMNWEGDAPR